MLCGRVNCDCTVVLCCCSLHLPSNTQIYTSPSTTSPHTARRKAKKMESKCAVIFFDEIDALGRSRVDEDGGAPSQAAGDNSSRRVLAELLIQMTELSSDNTADDDDEESDNEEEYEGYCDDGGSFIGHDARSALFGHHDNSSSNALLSPRSISPMPPSNSDGSNITTNDESTDGAAVEQVQTPTRSSSSAGKQGNAVKPRQPKPRVIVVAATNRPEDCDPALLRRFACRVLVGLPSRKDRKKIIKRLLSDVKNDLTPSQLDELALATEGWSGSDLESMTREAVMAPVRETLCAAAIQKRKASKAVKRSGAGSSQSLDQKQVDEDANVATREALLNSFRNLRPVSCKDFENGIAFFLGEQQESAAFGFGSGNKHSHYDSSDDSDNED
jgi:SpoVK/Ycf46/Vps4 family AAA+-type ATPase